MKHFHRFTALLLAVCLVFQICPVQVFAAVKDTPDENAAEETASSESLSAEDVFNM